jgi:hypothetical protein
VHRELSGGMPPTFEGDMFSSCVVYSELVTRTLACERLDDQSNVGLWEVQGLVDIIVSEVNASSDAHAVGCFIVHSNVLRECQGCES